MSEEMKACPFCGGTPTFESTKENYGDYTNLAFVHCPCGAQTGMSDSNSQAQEYWQHRPIEDALEAKVCLAIDTLNFIRYGDIEDFDEFIDKALRKMWEK